MWTFRAVALLMLAVCVPVAAAAKEDKTAPFDIDDCGNQVCAATYFPDSLYVAAPTWSRSVPSNMGPSAGGAVTATTIDLNAFAARMTQTTGGGRARFRAGDGVDATALTFWHKNGKRKVTVWLTQSFGNYIAICDLSQGGGKKSPCPFE